MASTDKFNKVLSGTTRPVATTLSAQKLSGATSFSVVAATGWETTTAVHGIMYRTDSQGNKIAGSQIDWKGDVSGTTVSNVIITAGTDDTYEIGDTVELSPTAAWGDDIATGILVEHNQDGTHGDVTADSITLGGIAHEKTKVNAPQGFMINGKIAVSVASNNLTVAIKTLADADPSATDPVYVRIGNTVRTISSALSVTKNAGTNWFGKGASYFATNESDYFVYLCWNTTDSAVTIAFSSTPSGLTYADFSTTSTNWNYWAGSGSAPSSTDSVENVGRFNATLSATASFNWSIPATSIVINKPCFETRVFTFTNTGTGAGTFYYQQIGSIKRVWGVSGSISTSTSSSSQALTFPSGFFTSIYKTNGSVRSVTTVAQQFFAGNGLSGTTNWSYYVFCQSGSGSATASLEVEGI